MNSQRNFYLFIIATIAVLGFGLILPPTVSMVLSSAFFAAITWFKPKWIMPLLILYFPVRPFLVEINSGLKLAGDLAILVLVIVVLYHALKKKDIKSIFQLEIYEWAYLAFCVVGAISALITGVSPTAIIFQLRKFLTMYLLFYGIKRLSWTSQDFTTIAKVIVGVGVVLSLHGFVEKLSQRNWLLPDAWVDMFVSQANADRIYGLIGNPNSMGLYMIIAIMVTFMLLRTTNDKRWYIALSLFVGTMLLTYSRGTFLGFLIAGAVYLALSKRWIILKQLAIATIAGLILVYLPIDFADQALENAGVEQSDGVKGESSDDNGGLAGRFNNKEEIERSSNSGRVFFVKKGFEIFMDYPIIGTGFGTFGDSAALVYSSPIYEDYGIAGIYDYLDKDFYSDNQYIQIIVQTGAVGVILFAIFLLNMAYRIWQLRPTNKAVANATIALWLFTSLVGVVYNIWENQVFPMFVFAIIAWVETIKQGKTVSVPGDNN
ncbi:O-antigen ligase family protein [Aquibacillus salsiterrae]|uniref:O-antigen ligase family protein n=1 Tax=Aquibacillus salsiterrae TaxID=2950439 RepID=A0A9X4AFX7_9BACI|nr:O-antigen ligase family protein [Aquibacillus salsiterrae]MDC3416695.1 O-antigen ligase family protein [Aquibacillus salsiterrae]